MKKTGTLVLFILLATGIIACSPGGGFQNQPSTCSYGREICVHIILPDTFDSTSPVSFKISVTSNNDLPDLHLVVSTDKHLVFDTPKLLEDSITKNVNTPGLIYWNFSIKAGETVTFDRTLHLPQQVGDYQIVAEAVTFKREIEAKESIHILISNDKGLVLRSGTPLPPFSAIITPELEVFGPGTTVPTPCCAINTPPVSGNPAATPSSTPTATQIAPTSSNPSPGLTPYP